MIGIATSLKFTVTVAAIAASIAAFAGPWQAGAPAATTTSSPREAAPLGRASISPIELGRAGRMIATPQITNHQSWSQIRRHFDTRKVEEAGQVLNGVCYMWESAQNAARRWRVIACWQDSRS